MLVEPEESAEIGVIGGSGLYDPSFVSEAKEIKVHTPYGSPSDSITIGYVEGKRVAFLPRHGRGHKIPPHSVNYRANIWAMKELGVKKIIGVSAVGSLDLSIKPGSFVIPDQFVDMTKGLRKYTFFDGPVVAHISMADPFCKYLRDLLYSNAKKLGFEARDKGTYLCIEGPRFSTRAESRIWHDVYKADIIGMTLVPEVNLACEAEMCYATVGMVTDYDVFAEVPVTGEEVERTMAQNIKNVKELIKKVIADTDPENNNDCSCCGALKKALM